MPPTKPQLTNNQWPNGVIRGPNILSALSLPMGSPWCRRFWNHLPCLFEKEDSGKQLVTGYFGFPRFFQMSLSCFKSVISFANTEGKLTEGLLSACLLSRLGGVFGVEGRCQIMKLHLFCQGCTNEIANRFNLSFTASPLPLFSIPVLTHNRENIHLPQHGLSLELIVTFHIGWHSTQFFIYFWFESPRVFTSPKCRNLID